MFSESELSQNLFLEIFPIVTNIFFDQLRRSQLEWVISVNPEERSEKISSAGIWEQGSLFQIKPFYIDSAGFPKSVRNLTSLSDSPLSKFVLLEFANKFISISFLIVVQSQKPKEMRSTGTDNCLLNSFSLYTNTWTDNSYFRLSFRALLHGHLFFAHWTHSFLRILRFSFALGLFLSASSI